MFLIFFKGMVLYKKYIPATFSFYSIYGISNFIYGNLSEEEATDRRFNPEI